MEEKVIQALLNQNNLGIFFVKNSKFMHVNKAFAAIFGYSKIEIMKLSFKELFPFSEISAIMGELVTHRQHNNFVVKGLKKDGTLIDVEFNKKCKIVSNSTSYIVGLIKADDNFDEENINYGDKLEVIVIKNDQGEIIGANSTYEKINSIRENVSFYQQNCYETDELVWETGLIKFQKKFKLPDNNSKFMEVTKIPIYNPLNSQDRYILIVASEVDNHNLDHLDKKPIIQLMDINLAVDSNSAMTVIDAKGIYKFVNNNFSEMLGYSKSELIGNSFIDINSGYHPKEFFDCIWSTIQNGMTWKGDVNSISKNGSFVSANVTIVPVLDTEGTPYQYITIRNDGARRIYGDDGSYLIFDNKKNKLALKEVIIERIRKKEDDISFAVLIIYVEQYDIVKVIYGEEIADRLIVQFIKGVKEKISNRGDIFRIDDDSLGVVYDIANENEVYQLIGEISSLGKEKINIDEYDVYISFKIGVGIYPLSCEKPSALIDYAKLALAQAKANNLQYLIYFPDFADKTLKTFLIRNELYKAMQKNEFVLYFQPRINEFNKMIGAEALIRWNHPDLGLIPPNRFISLAEETLLINPIGYWVIEKACENGKCWHDLGLKQFKISLNISAIQFSQLDFVKKVKQIIDDSGFSPQFLEFEITESTINDNDIVSASIKELREIGITIALDDFGSGYSSYDLLKQYNIDTLKIDRSLISDLNNNNRSMNIISSIINLANLLNINVVAEGVETKEQYNLLQSLNCKEFQGYLFNKPLPVNIFENLLVTNYDA